MKTDYTIKLDIFEGPLDLLLHLIKVNELEVTEIAISKITSQYLDTMRLMESLDLEVAADYLVMAATLINIKLRALLPQADDLEEESDEAELDEFLSARQLMQRLVEYRKFKEAATELGKRNEHQSQIFLREVALPKLAEAEATPPLRGDLETLLEAFTRVIRFVERRDYHPIAGEEYHVDDKITLLRRRLLIDEKMELGKIFVECRARLEMIVTLLAILELIRLKELHLVQGETFGEVFISPYRASETPPELVPEPVESEAVMAEAGTGTTGPATGSADEAPVHEEVGATVIEIHAGRANAGASEAPTGDRDPTP